MLEVVVSVRACAWSLDLLRWGLGRLFVLAVFTAPGRWHANGGSYRRQLPAAATGCATGGAMSGSA